MDYIVRGSVRREEGTIKITAVLINVSNGESIWSESYKGDVKDILRFQEEIPLKIVSALKLKLSADETKRVEARITDNEEAYDCYLHGADFLIQGTEQSLRTGIRLFNEAIRLDLKFSAAYSLMANCYYDISLNGLDSSAKKPTLDTAFRYAVKALTLDPRSAISYRTLSLIYGLMDNQIEAIAQAKKAVEIDPNNGESYYALGCAYGHGDTLLDEASRNLEKSIQLSPSKIWVYVTLFEVYEKLHREADRNRIATLAIPVYERYCLKYPEATLVEEWLGDFELFLGHKDEAIRRLLALSQSKRLAVDDHLTVLDELLKLDRFPDVEQTIDADMKNTDSREIKKMLKNYPKRYTHLLQLKSFQAYLR